MIFLWILFGIDLIAAAVLLYFFIIGIGDGSVSSFNMGLWLAMLGGVAAILGGGWMLQAKGHRGAAIGVLLILAIPAFLFGLFLLAVIILQPRWN
jgi:hypothetical protein